MTHPKIALVVAALAAVSAARLVADEPPIGVEWLIEADAPATQSASTGVDAKPMGPWGFDLTGMDKTVRPGDDFEKYVSGAWIARTPIPADRSRYGAFDELRELSDRRVLALLQQIARTATTLPAEATPEAADRVKLAGLLASYTNEAEIERRDVSPILPALAAVQALATPKDMAAFMGRSRGTTAGGDSTFGTSVGSDAKNPDYNTLYLGQSGLGLPDREYYLQPTYAKQKERYQQYVVQMLGLIGWPKPEAAAAEVVAFETGLAELHWTRAQNRDRDKTYNPMTVAALAELAPDFDWQTFLNAAGVGAAPQVVVAQVTAFPKIATLLARTPVDTFKAWQAFKVADEAAPLLSKRFAGPHFDFHGRFMNGQPQERSRDKRAAAFVQGVMGDAVGREYVAKYFPPDAKAKAEALVNDVKTAMRHRIERVSWMTDATREKALAKMSQFGVKIGYPEVWKDYSRLVVDPTDVFTNAQRAAQFGYAYRVGKLGQKVDKREWGMTPQTVNAYYNASQNEIVFPASILQPPFFDPNADPAINYGGIGAVIGHEITHGFDDQGRKSDGAGYLKDWWTAEDAAKFEAQAAKLGAQYETVPFPALPGAHINGKMTMGENIADLGGVLCALDAYHASLAGKPAPVLDGFTGDQRVFLGWAQVWRTLSRDAALKQQLATDSHSPGSVRVFGPLRNVDAWYDAFGVKEGDKQYVAPADRVRIW